MFRLTRKQLDSLGTLFGLIAGISRVLGANGVLDTHITGTVGGIAMVLLGVIVGKKPDTIVEIPFIDNRHS